jgi:hypothetical protein
MLLIKTKRYCIDINHVFMHHLDSDQGGAYGSFTRL